MPDVISIGGKLIAWQEISERSKGRKPEGLERGFADMVKSNLDVNFPLIFNATNTHPHPNLLPVLTYIPDGYNPINKSGDVLKWTSFRPETDYKRDAVLCYPFIKAPTLKSYLDSNTPIGLSEEELVQYFSNLCLGCHHLHRNRLVHRDANPSNVLVKFPDNTELLSEDPSDLKFEAVNYHIKYGPQNIPQGAIPDNLILIDHELVGRMGHADEIWNAATGTPGFQSPDQIQHTKPPKATSDIFSLGIIFAQMYFNEFCERPLPEMNTRRPITYELARQLQTVPFLKPRVTEVLVNATAFEQNNRYQDIPTFINDLQGAFVI